MWVIQNSDGVHEIFQARRAKAEIYDCLEGFQRNEQKVIYVDNFKQDGPTRKRKKGTFFDSTILAGATPEGKKSEMDIERGFKLYFFLSFVNLFQQICIQAQQKSPPRAWTGFMVFPFHFKQSLEAEGLSWPPNLLNTVGEERSSHGPLYLCRKQKIFARKSARQWEPIAPYLAILFSFAYIIDFMNTKIKEKDLRHYKNLTRVVDLDDLLAINNGDFMKKFQSNKRRWFYEKISNKIYPLELSWLVRTHLNIAIKQLLIKR